MAKKTTTVEKSSTKNETAAPAVKTSGDLQLKGLGTISVAGVVKSVKGADGSETSFAIVGFESEGMQFSLASARPNVAQYASVGRAISFQGRVLRMQDGVICLKGNLQFLGRPAGEDTYDPFSGE